MKLAVLRPEPGASATLRRAEKAGFEAFALPLFRIEPIGWRLPESGDFDALLLTSANAVRQAGGQMGPLRHLPVHAVGEATARAAHEAGLAIASVGHGGVEALLASLPASTRLLHLCGEHRHSPAPGSQAVVPVPVYRSIPIPAPAGLERLKGAAALVHSPRAGRRLAELVKQRADIAVLAISPAAAEACGGGWRAVLAAEQPTDAAMLSLAGALCKHSPPQ